MVEKNIIAGILSSLFILSSFSGCTAFEDLIAGDVFITEPVNGFYSDHLTDVEVSAIIENIINDGTMILGRVLDIKRGIYSPSDEAEVLEAIIDSVEEGIESLELMTFNVSDKDKHQKIIDAANEYKNAILEYRSTLLGGDFTNDDLDVCADKIESAMALVKTRI